MIRSAFLFVALLSVCHAFTTHPTILDKPTPPLLSTRRNIIRGLLVRGGNNKPDSSASNMSSSASTTQMNALTDSTAAAASWIVSNMEAGPLGVLALTAVASAVCIPVTQYQTLLGVSIGYGLSVAAIGCMLRIVFAQSGVLGNLLTGALVCYGIRLALFLWVRRWSYDPSYDATASGKEPKEPPRIKRIPFALSLSLLYACMTAPAMYALRSGATDLCVKIGTILAWIGVVVQAITDAQKYHVKKNFADGNKFVGPTGGLYQLTRHPNYTAEVMVWLGVYTAGITSFQKNIVAWVASTLGFVAIFSIMQGATKRLEEKHKEKYAGQEAYESWKSRVPVPLFPFLPKS